MCKLNIDHKSYHRYQRNNILKVRRDKEEVRLKEIKEEGRMSLAVSTLPFVDAKTKAKTRILKHECNCYLNAAAYRMSLQRRSKGRRRHESHHSWGLNSAYGLADDERAYQPFRAPRACTLSTQLHTSLEYFKTHLERDRCCYQSYEESGARRD